MQKTVFALLLVVALCPLATHASGEESSYIPCGENSPTCAGADTECCYTSTEEGVCINTTMNSCPMCRGSPVSGVCKLDQDCCSSDCYTTSTQQCCAYWTDFYVCSLNDTCCGSSCCSPDLACTTGKDGYPACVDYPPSPVCGQPCKSDTDCTNGGSACGSCADVGTGYAKICSQTKQEKDGHVSVV